METITFFYLALMQFCLHDLIDKKTQFFPIILLLLGRMLSPLFFLMKNNGRIRHDARLLLHARSYN